MHSESVHIYSQFLYYMPSFSQLFPDIWGSCKVMVDWMPTSMSLTPLSDHKDDIYWTAEQLRDKGKEKILCESMSLFVKLKVMQFFGSTYTY